MSNIKRAPAAQVECANDGGGVIRLISKPEVLDRVGVSYPTLWSWMREGKFPRSRQLGGKAAWIEAEIEEWINALPVRRLKGDAVQKVA
jgi:predicted DNA-binding transcriptional regulator AlpA